MAETSEVEQETIIIATGNAHKVSELRTLFAQHGIVANFIPMSDVLEDIQIDETGTTFEENAYIKARTVHELTGLPCIADDSGLEVSALNNAPGVYSARYSGENATDTSNREFLRTNLMQLRKEQQQSPAQFRCVLCYVNSNAAVFGEGTSYGTITLDERGENGFGYDAMFVAAGATKTYAELTTTEKLAISHRAQAVEQLATNLITPATPEQIFSDSELRIRACVYAVQNKQQELLALFPFITPTEEVGFQLYEALLQTYLFAGFPAALDALTTYHSWAQEQPWFNGWSSAEQFDVSTFEQRGTRTCKQVYESVYERMMDKLSAISPDLQHWMLVEGYGKTLSRTPLSLIERELCIVAVLATQGRTTQLKSHIRGARLVGATPEQLSTVVDVITELVGWKVAEEVTRYK